MMFGIAAHGTWDVFDARATAQDRRSRGASSPF
jgi:hypothetical protein